MIVILGLLLIDSRAFSISFVDYIKKYNVGLVFINEKDSAEIEFLVDTNQNSIDSSVTNCGTATSDRYRRCMVNFSTDRSGGFGSEYFGGVGITFQQPFERQGDLYLNWDVSVSIQSIKGEWQASEDPNLFSGLSNLSYSLYGIYLKPYIQLGWTPKVWPDFLISFGPLLSGVAGSVAINGVERDAAFAQSTQVSDVQVPWAQAFFEVEVVFFRIGEGAFSWYGSSTIAKNTNKVGDFYDESVDGMSEFSPTFSQTQSDLKLILDLP